MLAVKQQTFVLISDMLMYWFKARNSGPWPAQVISHCQLSLSVCHCVSPREKRCIRCVSRCTVQFVLSGAQCRRPAAAPVRLSKSGNDTCTFSNYRGRLEAWALALSVDYDGGWLSHYLSASPACERQDPPSRVCSIWPGGHTQTVTECAPTATTYTRQSSSPSQTEAAIQD